MQIQSKQYFVHLDGLRTVLAFVVIGIHTMLAVVINKFVVTDFLERLVVVFNSGHLAVSVFFVLSGFLITYLMIEEKEKTGAFKIKEFYIRRIFRIWPLYYAVLIFGFFIYPFVKSLLGYVDQNPYSLLHQLLFLGNFDSIRVHEQGLVGMAPMMISITWSVCIEEQFYLIWPLAFALVRPSRFWIVCVTVIVCSFIFRTTTANYNLYYHTFSVISDMAFGALSACLIFYSRAFLGFFETMPKYVLLAFYVFGFLILMYADTITANFLSRNYRVVSALFFCFIILEQCYCRHSIYKFGRIKILSSTGKYTYGLYMLHSIGIQSAIIFFRTAGMQHYDTTAHGLIYCSIAIVISLILAVLSYRFLESYFLDKRKNFY